VGTNMLPSKSYAKSMLGSTFFFSLASTLGPIGLQHGRFVMAST
jgi:hypothetical protein